MTWEFALEPLMGAVMGSVRIIAVLMTAPVFSFPNIPQRVRYSTAAVLAFCLAPTISGGASLADWTLLHFAGAIVSEALTGLALGVGLNLVFTGFLFLGAFISRQSGLGMARNIDPATGVSSQAVASVIHTFALMVFLAIDGHHEVVRAVAISFERVPIGSGGLSASAFGAIPMLGSSIWEIGVRLAMPITVTVMLQNLTMGVLARALPQMNLLMVQLPLHVGMVIGMLALGAYQFRDAFVKVLTGWPERVMEILWGSL